MIHSRRWLGALPVVVTLACGSSHTAPESPTPASESAASAEAPAESAPVEATPPASASAAASMTPPPADSAAAQGAPAADADAPPRDVKYIVTAGALDVEVEGIRFVTTAETVKNGDGWGVVIKSVAKVKDDKAHNLLAPKNGPMAFAGTVTRNGAAERFGDKREGDQGLTLKSAKGTEIKREWPEKGGQPLKAGDELQLEVGLWGIGDDANSRRPMRDFLLVKVKVGKGKPIAVLLPPVSAGKK